MKSKTPSKNRFASALGPKKPLASAKSKAVALLARREHSQSELRAKLQQRGYEAEEVEQAIEWATSHQFQSDDRFKLSLFRRRASTFGDRAISAELGQHGLGDLKSIEFDESRAEVFESEEDRAYDWIKRRQLSALASVLDETGSAEPGQLMALKAKVFRGLSSRGFEFGNIDRAWRRILAEFKSNA
ncbi:regulatory protein RecX [Limnobacter parvus]|uniref:Regulatory protein RecX n=1 Tax=Limnobacter parvus TaxID=2939690 RepID=A0ABT1XHL4_9BURK|nr:regulatory protein RecX [Limnobacter parvus]MCR2746386.1 recombination regulator RecX [Limnobacter parvus]